MDVLWFLFTIVFQTVSATDLVNVLQSNGGKTFASLLHQVGLTNILETDNFTVFAPSDESFQRLPVFLLDILRHDNDTLYGMLAYHIVRDEVLHSDMSNNMKLWTLLDDPIRINLYNNNTITLVEGTKLERRDKKASNGIVHILDRIMRPPHGSIMDILHNDKDISIFYDLIQRTSLRNLLNDSGANLTVFAPTNQAFSDLMSKLLIDDMVNNTKAIEDILRYHIVDNTVYQLALRDGLRLPTLLNTSDELKFRIYDLGLHVDNSLITVSDSSATNGVIHMVDKLLIPSSHVIDGSITMKTTNQLMSTIKPALHSNFNDILATKLLPNLHADILSDSQLVTTERQVVPGDMNVVADAVSGKVTVPGVITVAEKVTDTGEVTRSTNASTQLYVINSTLKNVLIPGKERYQFSTPKSVVPGSERYHASTLNVGLPGSERVHASTSKGVVPEGESYHALTALTTPDGVNLTVPVNITTTY